MMLGRALAAGLVAPLGAVAADEELNLFAWSEYVPQSVLDGFTKETGIQVNYESYASNEEMLAKLMSGASSYDLIQPSEYAVEALAQAGRLEALDRANIPNFSNLSPQYLNQPFDAGNKFSVPYMVGTVGIAVNTGKVKEPITGYVDFFSDKYKGRLVVLDDGREIVSWALAAKGRSINDITPATLAEVRPLIASWLKNVKLFDSASPKTALLNGEVDMGIVWSGEGAILVQEDPKFAYVLPKEGAHMFIDSLCIPKGAKNKAAAEAFINYILKPEVSKVISDEFPYTNPNLEARKLLTEAQLKNGASYPAKGKLETFKEIGAVSTLIDDLITELKSDL
jgi:spermidine/putrescine transport system substrate-binding protein